MFPESAVPFRSNIWENTHSSMKESFFFKKKNLDFMKLCNRVSNLLEVQGKDKHVKQHYRDAVNKIWTLGNSAGQMTRFLQKITSKGKRYAEKTYRLK